jgi:hypothetical protein
MYNKEISKLKNKLISLGEQEEAKLLEKRAFGKESFCPSSSCRWC